MKNLMEARDSVSGSLAECYVTLTGRRYCLMQLTEFESKWGITLTDVPILGRVQKGKKPTGAVGTWTAKAHYNQSVLRAWLLHYKKTGMIEPFEIQVSNEDPSSRAGRQTITYTGCYLDNTILAKFTTGDEILTEELSGTFDDWDMPETFTELEGM